VTPNFVPDDGPRTARFVLVGEAPGKWENLHKRPFVGWSGKKLDDWWRRAGLHRSHFYLTNVWPFQPPGNKIGLVPRADLARAIDDLHDRIAALADPWVLVPTGDTALRALLGRGAPITRLRGSLFPYVDRGGRPLKVIPTIHPAAIARTPYWEGRCIADWARIAAEGDTRDLRLPEREHLTAPTYDDCLDLLAECQHADALAIDIETPRALTIIEQGVTKTGKPRRPKRILGPRRITCLAVAPSPARSVTIPTTLAYWRDPEMLAAVWRIVQTIAALPTPKATHNGLFDWWWLAQHDVGPTAWQWDTNAMSHCLAPGDDHSLAYCASIDTRQPYWKDMKDTKDDDTAGEPTEDALGTFWRYCGIDAAVTRELLDVYADRLEKRGLLAYYHAHYGDLLAPLLAASTRGLRIDEPARRRRSAALKARLIGIQDRLTALAGEPLYAAKSLSNPRLRRFLYETLRLPALYAKRAETDDEGRTKRTVTTNEVAVRRLMLKHAHVPLLQEAGPLILDHRRTEKLGESYQDSLVDADGRVRYAFGFAPETGRFSSGKAPHGRGRNIQNADRETRDIYLPDEGQLLLEVDLSQAEDRIVKAYCVAGMPPSRRRDDLLWRARALPHENDEHTRAACALFPHTTPATVAPDQRYLAKRVRHASNYGEMGATLSDVMLKDGLVHTAEECQHMLDTIHGADPEVQAIYQKGVRATLMRARRLTNPWGWAIDFPYERLDDTLFRRGYAWRPQSTVPQLINQWGIVPLYRLAQAGRVRAHVHLQGHDSLLASVHPDDAWRVAAVLRASLERPLTYEGPCGAVDLTIPIELKVGRRWGCGTCLACRARGRCAEVVAFKRFPGRDEFAATVTHLQSHH
jgi:uracil-DNA glycosylase family 4